VAQASRLRPSHRPSRLVEEGTGNRDGHRDYGSRDGLPHYGSRDGLPHYLLNRKFVTS
jgi:hypothetical protein